MPQLFMRLPCVDQPIEQRISGEKSPVFPLSLTTNGPTDQTDRIKLLSGKGFARFHPLTNRLANGPTDGTRRFAYSMFIRGFFSLSGSKNQPLAGFEGLDG